MKFYYFLLFFTYTLIARENIFFNHLSLNPNSEEEKVLDFTLDNNGILWIAGDNGLYRYTGDKIIKYNHEPKNINSLTFNQITKLYVDSKNVLWIGSSLGLNVYDEKTNCFKNYINSPKSFLNELQHSIVDITEDLKHNCYWFLDSKKGLYKYIPKQNRLVYYGLKIPQNIIYQRFIQTDNHLYIASSMGIIEFNTDVNKFKFTNTTQFKTNCVFKFRNYIFFSHTNGLAKYNLDTKECIEILANNEVNYISDISQMNNHILLACDGDGLKLLNPITHSIETYTKEDDSQLSTNNVTTVYLDKNNILWVGTYMHGINYSSFYSKFYNNISNGLNIVPHIEFPVVKSITLDPENNLWIGTDRAGIYLKKTGQQFELFNPETNLKINFSKLAVTDLFWVKNKLYISTFGQGLFVYDIKNNKVEQFNSLNSILKTNNIKSIFYDSKKNLWVGTFEFGLYKLDSAHVITEYESIKNNIHSNCFVNQLEDSEGNIFFATEYGLVKYTQKTNTFKKFLIQTNEEYNATNSLNDFVYFADRHEIWIGSHGNGIYKFNIKLEKFSKINKENINNIAIISSMSIDKYQNLWVAAKNGIYQINPNTLEILKTINENTGVNINSISPNTGMCLNNNTILFGSNKGLIQINPDKFKINSKAPPIVINEIKITKKTQSPTGKDSLMYKTVNLDSTINLEYNENDIEISFSALNFINPNGNKYKYKLKGYERTWRHVSKNLVANYINIPPGNYEFEILASNNDGIWNSKGTSIKINIKHPWWNSTWFYSSIVITLIILLYLIYYIRLRAINKLNEFLKRRIDEQTKELSEANANLKILLYKTSHDVRGPIKSLSTLTQLAIKEVTEKTGLMYLNHIFNSSKRIENMVEDLLTVTNPNLGKNITEIENIETLIKESIDSLKHLKGADRIAIKYDIKNNAEKFFSCTKSINSIIQNLIENPIKYQDYRKEKSYLNIDIVVNPDEVIFKFSDNGIGIPEASKSKIFDMFYRAHNTSSGSGLGLYITKSVIDKLNGSLSFESTEYVGSEFVVKIPNLKEATKNVESF